MATNTNNLWSITDGQRARYGGAVLAMAGASLFMFSAPLIGGYAIDVVESQRVDAAVGDELLAVGHAIAGIGRRGPRRARVVHLVSLVIGPRHAVGYRGGRSVSVLSWTPRRTHLRGYHQRQK